MTETDSLRDLCLQLLSDAAHALDAFRGRDVEQPDDGLGSLVEAISSTVRNGFVVTNPYSRQHVPLSLEKLSFWSMRLEDMRRHLGLQCDQVVRSA